MSDNNFNNYDPNMNNYYNTNQPNNGEFDVFKKDQEKLPLKVSSLEEINNIIGYFQIPIFDVCRFAIGFDCKESKCFGIYYDQYLGEYVVYKNKADGSRAIRYQGPDEQMACQIIWDKFIEEVKNRPAFARKFLPDYVPNTTSRSNNYRSNSSYGSTNRRGISASSLINGIGIFLACAILVFVFCFLLSQPSRGYYLYDDEVYYYNDGSWYYYDDYYDTWDYYYDDDYEFLEDYYYGTSYDYIDYAFEDTDFYYESDYNSDYDSGWDSDWDSDWDSGWDSGGSDWDSDW